MSNARSPREVCSITIGITCSYGLMLAPCCRGSTVSQTFLVFPSPASKCSLAPRDLDRNPLDIGGEPVERGAQPQVLAQPLVGSRLAQPRDGLVEVFVGLVDLLAPTPSTSSSEIVIPAWSATASSTSSRATDGAASARSDSTSWSGERPLSAMYASSERPRRSTLRARPLSSSRVRTSTSGPPAATSVAARACRPLPCGTAPRAPPRAARAGRARCRRATRRACRTRSPCAQARRRAAAGPSRGSPSASLDGARLVARRRESRPKPSRRRRRRRARSRAPARAVRRRARRRSRVRASSSITRSSTSDVAGLRGTFVDRREVGGRLLQLLHRLLDELRPESPARPREPRASSSRAARASAARRPSP